MRPTFKLLLLVVSGALVVLSSLPAHAGLAGSNVAVGFGFCNDCELPTFEAAMPAVALPGSVMAPNSNDHHKFSFTDDSITLSMNAGYSTGFCCVNPALYPGHNFNGWRLQFSGGDAIASVTLGSFAAGGLRPEVSWTSDTIYLNMWGGQLSVDSPVVLRVVTAPVPEASTHAMLFAGLAAMGLAMRRNRNA